MKKTGISILCFLLVSLSLSNLFAETDSDSEIQITKKSKILQVVKASKSQKDGYTLISFRTKLRDYTLMPYGFRWQMPQRVSTVCTCEQEGSIREYEYR